MALTGDYIENSLLDEKMMFNLVRANTYRKVVHEGDEMEMINFHSALHFDDSDMFYLTPAFLKTLGCSHPSAIEVNRA